MKILWGLIVLIALAAVMEAHGDHHKGKGKGGKAWKNCVYRSQQNEEVYYDLNGLALKEDSSAYAFGSTDNSSSATIYFTVCGSLDELLDLNGVPINCAEGSAACVSDESSETSIGLWKRTSFTEVSGGLTLAYAPVGDCDGNGTNYRTYLNLECDLANQEMTVTSVETPDTCTTIINARTLAACPTDWKSVAKHWGGRHQFLRRFAHFGFILLAVILSVCCCACCIRRRRAAKLARQQMEMGRFVDVAFQPLSQVSVDRPAPVAISPQMMYPQMPPVYVYPSAQPVPASAPTTKEAQIQSDERLAKQLQDKLNQGMAWFRS